MSAGFELDDKGWRQRVADSRMSDFDFEQALKPGFFEGGIRGPANAFMRGTENMMDFLNTIIPDGAPAPDFYSDADVEQFYAVQKARATPEGRDAFDFQQRELSEQSRRKALAFWTPNPTEIGTAGRVLGGFAQIAPAFLTGPAAPVVAAGTETLASGKELIDQGVDLPTAQGMASVRGLGTYAGLKMPFLGKTLATKMLAGGVGNTALGAGLTEADRAILESRGYKDLAKQYDPLDPTSRAIDLLTGMAFGGVAHLGREMPPSERAAVMTAQNAKHFQQDTAPGIPQDPAADQAHQRAMEMALEALDRGEPVQVPPEVASANFAPRPPREDASDAVREVLGDIPEPKAEPQPSRSAEIPLTDSLKPEDQAIEKRFAEQIGGDVEAATEQYARLKDSHGGKILNTDTARELSPEYLKDRTKSSAVHEPASWLVRQMYAQKLAEPPAAGEEPRVIFSAGGTGAGKTTGLQKLGGLVDRSQVVYDTNMNTFDSAVTKIDQALAAGKNVTLLYVFRHPIEALKNGALTRAARQEREFGSGRTVPLKDHIDTHVGSRETMDRLAAHYAGDPRFEMKVVDNSRGRDKAALVKLSEIPKFKPEEYNPLREQAAQTVASELKAGRISEAVARGFAENDAPGVQPEAGGTVRAEPQQASGGGRVAFEQTGAQAPKPGQPFFVLRFGKSNSLTNRNAGNPQSVAEFIARAEDHERPQSHGGQGADHLYVYQVTAPEAFGKYELAAKGKPMGEETIGRRADKNGVSYSFPDKAQVDAKPVLELPLDEVRAALKARTGTDSFDDLGSVKGGQALEAIIAERTAPTQSVATAKSAAAPKVSDMFGLRTPQGGVVEAVKQVLEQQDVPVATGEVDAEGNRVTRSGREIMAQADAEVAEAETKAKGYEAAVGCLLTRGFDNAA